VGTAGTHPALGLAGGKLAAAIVLTFAAGVGTGIAADRVATPTPSVSSTPTTPSVSRTAVMPSLAPPPPPLPRADEAPVVPAVSLPSAPGPRPTPSAAPSEESTRAGSGLAAERALLDVARAALARGSAAEALEATTRHEHDYPAGLLVEEREAIAIRALAALGRRDEANARADAFAQRFPRSLNLGGVKAAVDGP
jgi:hypothetical protein